MNIKPRKRLEMDWAWLRACVDFTPQEKILLAGVLAVALIGLTARWWILVRSRPPAPAIAPVELFEEANP